MISQSFHRNSEQTSSGLSFDHVYKDHLTLYWPYPTICEAAGNGVSTEYVNHKGFNRLTVGNHNDEASAMASDSVFLNPISSHGDRELPEIAANGVAVTTVHLTKSGTSMATPAVAGGAALIQQTSATLRSWPEGCRAILLASAWRNPAGGTWWSDTHAGTLRIRDSKNGEGRTVPITGRLTATLHAYTAAAHPAPESSDHVFYSAAAGRPINQATVYIRFRGYLADAGIPHFNGKLSTAAEYEAVLGGISAPGALAPRLVAGRLPGGRGCLCAPASSDDRERRDSLLDLQGLDVLAAVVREHGAQGRPYAVSGFGCELRNEPGVYGEDGPVGGFGPVVPRDRVEGSRRRGAGSGWRPR